MSKLELVDAISKAGTNGWFDLDWIQQHLPAESNLLDAYRAKCEKISKDLLMEMEETQLQKVLQSMKTDSTKG